MTQSQEFLKQQLSSSELGDRLKALNQSRGLPDADRFELVCIAGVDPSARVRYDALSQMSSLGQQNPAKAKQILWAALLNLEEEIDVRAAAADSIGALKLDGAFEILNESYHQTNEWLLAMSIVAALGELGDRRSFDLLSLALENENTLIKIAAVGALGDLGDQRAIDLLVSLAEQPEWEVRHRIAQSLTALVLQAEDENKDKSRVIATLQKLSQDESQPVATAATDFLAQLNR
ncbi:HEAT repeat domain-containing protein [Thalassoporum mexicanum]|uniref:HEAT repeat domain-containing protein n=1 Tax=Thalassoporum mexicanum TaxID=3457544 RepID=UPI0002FE189A|nr:HEAT repeat domain-containing protein [Pseudanabaena sp. PCC 7367]